MTQVERVGSASGIQAEADPLAGVVPGLVQVGGAEDQEVSGSGRISIGTTTVSVPSIGAYD